MNVGVCKIQLHLPGSQSLKDKRRVIQSIIVRLCSEFRISVAEIDTKDLWQLATLGIACVSNHSRHANEILSHVVNFISKNFPQVEMVNYEIEIVPVL